MKERSTEQIKDVVPGRSLPEAFFRKCQKDPNKDIFFNKRGGQWKGTKYRECLEFVRRTMAGLKARGFKPGDKIVIFSENRNEWILTDYAAQWLGGATAAIYTSSTPEQIRHIVNDCEGSFLFLSNADLLKRLDGLEGMKTLKYVVAWDSIDSKVKLQSGVEFVRRDQFLSNEMSEVEAEALLQKLDENTLAILIYTSGTTGEPKGVMLTHRNMLSDVNTMLRAVPDLTVFSSTISFLPLSHVYERSLHNMILLLGMHIYFAESLDKLIDNVVEIRPEFMIFVPRIFEKMYSRIFQKIKNASMVEKKVFSLALWIGRKTFPYRYNHQKLPWELQALHALADIAVFRKIRAITGGRAQMFISGGAPLSQEIAEFFFTVGFSICEGYGISETCILCVNRPWKIKFGTVGPPFDLVNLKIADDGEILVKGPMVMKGYYKMPDATNEAIDKEGWYHTGDIGEIDEEGFLKITDRKKDLIATAGGKKVAPQPIENSLKKDPLIENVCLVGDKKKYITALVVPNLELCRTWAQSKGFELTKLDECARNEKLREHFQKEFDRVNAELPRFSTIKDFRVLSTPFSLENGDLTPTLKLKRRVIQEHYQSVIDSMYGQDEDFKATAQI